MKNFNLNNKTLLITGGTGSFGKRFIRKILENYKIKKIVVYSRDELKQSEMYEEFIEYKDKIRYFIGDVRDADRLKLALKSIDIVIHAAALKQVPAAEYNPFEFIKTNIIGTQNLISAIMESNVERAISLSTDKAAAPINIYGATKLAADKLFISSNNISSKKFSVVRYGNVMMSRGSVMPIFEKQSRAGVLTITDKRMTRFSITLDQGVDFVIQCLKKMWGGELFVPKIPSYKTTDVAKAIAPNCKIKFTGIRPGEKLHEEMITASDSLNTLEFKKYYVILPSTLEFLTWKLNDFIKNSDQYQAKFCKENFSYNSSTNSKFLSVKEIKELVEKEKIVYQKKK